jgi:hypothetical protein
MQLCPIPTKRAMLSNFGYYSYSILPNSKQPIIKSPQGEEKQKKTVYSKEKNPLLYTVYCNSKLLVALGYSTTLRKSKVEQTNLALVQRPFISLVLSGE